MRDTDHDRVSHFIVVKDCGPASLQDLNWQAWTRGDTIDPAKFEILATTDRFDHCVFAVRQDFPAETEAAWLSVLFSMSSENPDHRAMMDLEGLKQWEPGRALGDREIGLGCVNPRTGGAESPESIVARAREALQFWKPEQIFLNPDCGFGCFANRCVNDEATATAKLRSMTTAARTLRGLI